MNDTTHIAPPGAARGAAQPVPPSVPRAALRAARSALEWRLLVLWLVLLLVPAIVAALPLWQLLATSMDYSVHAAELAQRLDMVALADLGAGQMRYGAALGNGAIVALVLTLLLSPLLSGMTISAARAPRQLGFGALAAGGMAEYGRLLRMLVWSVVPLGVAGVLAGLAMKAAHKAGEAAILAADAERADTIAMIGAGLVMLLALASLDAGRALLATDLRRRSAVVAWWHGCALLARRPLAALGIYAVISALGLALAALLAVARLNFPALGVGGFFGALALAQLAVLAVAWTRGARLMAMIELARTHRRA